MPGNEQLQISSPPNLESLTSIAPFTTDTTTYHIKDSGQLEWFGWSVWSIGWGDFIVQLVEVSLGRLSGWFCVA